MAAVFLCGAKSCNPLTVRSNSVISVSHTELSEWPTQNDLSRGIIYISHGSKSSLPIQEEDLYIILKGTAKLSSQCMVITVEKWIKYATKRLGQINLRKDSA